MEMISHQVKDNFIQTAKEIGQRSIKDPEMLQRLLSQVDTLSRNREGLNFLYDHLELLLKTDILTNTPWKDPNHLVPELIGGTLKSGFPHYVFEIISELRMLKIGENDLPSPDMNSDNARIFLKDAIVANFNLIFQDYSEEMRNTISRKDLKRVKTMFEFILSRIPVKDLENELADEVEAITEQRPIITSRVEEILKLTKDQNAFTTNKKTDLRLQYYTESLFYPTPLAKKNQDVKQYLKVIKAGSKPSLLSECKAMGEKMEKTGLVSAHQVTLLKYSSTAFPELIPVLLKLNSHGKAEFEMHHPVISLMINDFITPSNKQSVYGLKRLLERNLFSQTPVWNAFNKLTRIKIHTDVKKNLLKLVRSGEESSAMQLLVGGVINVLGIPLGIGQGNNPTCQSARGISMWSQHAPGKLLNIIIDAATSNNLSFRYEGELIESSALSDGVTKKVDFNLDPVSIVLVPHLDKIYNEMMKRAALKHFGQDPHISVNPAFYGHWIQTGFVSAYNSLFNAIVDYNKFVRIFYGSFHPQYNGGNHIVYPIPLGIFITSSRGEFLGFHAISLLRVDKDPSGEWRIYFYNPNNEGRQNWGQSIEPTVARNGEQHGESSLPFHQLASRVYAFHYNTHGIKAKLELIPMAEVNNVKKMAKESWGKKYIWQ